MNEPRGVSPSSTTTTNAPGRGDQWAASTSIPPYPHAAATAASPKRFEALSRTRRPVKDLKKLIDCLVLVNAGFSVRGRPIVGTPGDPFR
jgi:hypothetical protein